MAQHQTPRRIVITAGPTHEPIDAVRYLANRSSGRLGEALALEAARRGWSVTLLLGPVNRSPNYTQIHIERFITTADLQALLREHAPSADVLIMAAAVADFRPAASTEFKLKRSSGPITLELEPTPDLLLETAQRRRPGQVIIGFALEDRERMLMSAVEKVQRKDVDAIVANPLETMDSDMIEATLVWRDGSKESTGARITKDQFAAWLLDRADVAQPA